MSKEPITSIDKEPLQDRCGIVAAYSKEDSAAFIPCLAGLNKIQTRGYDGAGVFGIKKIGEGVSYKESGRITKVFTEEVVNDFRKRTASVWLLQTRYGTNGDSREENIQPIVREYGDSGEVFALVHNGQFVRTVGNGNSDSVVFADELAKTSDKNWDERIVELHRAQGGAWSLAIGTKNALYLLRDPYGIRPLACGKIIDPLTKEEVLTAASETAALLAMGAKDFWEVPPGSVIKISDKGVETIYQSKAVRPAPCIFENVYLDNGKSVVHRAAKDRVLNTEPTVERFRKKCGAILAGKEDPGIASRADIVCGIPGTGIAGGRGYSEALGVAYVQAITDRKPQETDARTFMTPNIKDIPDKILKHFYFESSFFRGMKVILVDDSIVRGNITNGIIKLLKQEYGVLEVHIRVLCPPINKPCYLGINTRKREELIAAVDGDLSLEEVVESVRKKIGADSLAYITSEDLRTAAGGGDFCMGCMLGHQPPVSKNTKTL